MASISDDFSTGLTHAYLHKDGQLLTDEVGANNLTNNGTVTRVAGVQDGGANYAKASSQYLSLAGNNGVGHENLSIAFWFNPTSQPATNSTYFLWKNRTATGGNYIDWGIHYMDISGTKKIRIHRNKPGVVGIFSDFDVTLTNGTDYYIVMTYATSVWELYVDAVKEIDTTADGVGTGGADEFSIGYGAEDYAGKYTDGVISQFLVYSEAISTDYVSGLYASGDGVPYETPAVVTSIKSRNGLAQSDIKSVNGLTLL